MNQYRKIKRKQILKRVKKKEEFVWWEDITNYQSQVNEWI